MATVRATWRRTVQVRPYEPEVLEMFVEVETGSDAPEDVADLVRELCARGDALVVERQMAHGLIPKDGPGVSEPDEFV